MAKWRASGLSASEYAKGKDYAPKTLTWWASRLKRAGYDPGSETTVPMARVVVAADPSESNTTVSRSRSGGSGVALEVAAVRVSLDVAFDAATLEATLDVLEARARRYS